MTDLKMHDYVDYLGVTIVWKGEWITPDLATFRNLEFAKRWQWTHTSIQVVGLKRGESARFNVGGRYYCSILRGPNDEQYRITSPSRIAPVAHVLAGDVLTRAHMSMMQMHNVFGPFGSRDRTKDLMAKYYQSAATPNDRVHYSRRRNLDL